MFHHRPHGIHWNFLVLCSLSDQRWDNSHEILCIHGLCTFAQYGLLEGPLNDWLSEVLMYRPPRDFPFCKMDSHILDTLGNRQELSAIGGTSQWHWTLWVEVLYGLWLLICFQKCNIVLLNWNCWWEVGNCWFVGIGCFFFTFFYIFRRLRGPLSVNPWSMKVMSPRS